MAFMKDSQEAQRGLLMELETTRQAAADRRFDQLLTLLQQLLKPSQSEN